MLFVCKVKCFRSCKRLFCIVTCHFKQKCVALFSGASSFYDSELHEHASREADIFLLGRIASSLGRIGEKNSRGDLETCLETSVSIYWGRINKQNGGCTRESKDPPFFLRPFTCGSFLHSFYCVTTPNECQRWKNIPLLHTSDCSSRRRYYCYRQLRCVSRVQNYSPLTLLHSRTIRDVMTLLYLFSISLFQDYPPLSL